MTPQASMRIRSAIARLRANLAELEQALEAAGEEAHLDPVAAKEVELREACAARGITISGDGYVTEKAAAELLNRSALTLRNRRKADRPIECRDLDGRPEYPLIGLARFIVLKTSDSDEIDL